MVMKDCAVFCSPTPSFFFFPLTSFIEDYAGSRDKAESLLETIKCVQCTFDLKELFCTCPSTTHSLTICYRAQVLGDNAGAETADVADDKSNSSSNHTTGSAQRHGATALLNTPVIMAKVGYLCPC